MQKLFRSLIAVGGLAGLVACGDDVSIAGPGLAISGAPVTAISVGAKVQLSANEAVSWASSAANVATVDATGLVTAVAAGTASITATSTANPDRKASVTITVSSAVRNVTVSPPNAVLLPGGTLGFVANVDADAGVARTVTWTSSNTAVATITAAGVVTAVTPGSATITAASTVAPTVTGSAVVTVRQPTPATISVQNITISGTNNVTANVNNIAGSIDVNMNVDPGEQVVQRVEVLIDGTVACSQNLSGAQSEAMRIAAAFDDIEDVIVSCQVNTAKFSEATGVADFFNGGHTLSVRAIIPGGSDIATPSTQLIFNNTSGVIATFTNTNGSDAASAINTTTGLQWISGDVTWKFTGVSYVQGTTVSSVNCTVFGKSPRNFALTNGTNTTVYDEDPWSGTDLDLGFYLTDVTLPANVSGAAGAEAIQCGSAVLSNGQPMATTSGSVLLNYGSPANPTVGGNAAMPILQVFRYDGMPPGSSPSLNGVTQASLASVASAVTIPWVNSNSSLVPPATQGSTLGIPNFSVLNRNTAGMGNDIEEGVDAIKVEVFVPAAGGTLPTSTASGPNCNVTGLTAVTTGSQLAETTVSTAYPIRFVFTDALGNRNCADLGVATAIVQSGVNFTGLPAGNTSIGADFTPPTATIDNSSPVANTGYATSPPNFSVTASDNASGFTLTPLRVNMTRLNPDGTTDCVINTGANSCNSAGVNPNGTTASQQLSFDATGGADLVGYYTTSINIRDQAGNQTTLLTGQVNAFDNVLPTFTGGISLPAVIAGAATNTFTTTVGDNLDLGSIYGLVNYPGVNLNLRYPTQQIGTFGAPLEQSSANLGYAVANWIRCLNPAGNFGPAINQPTAIALRLTDQTTVPAPGNTQVLVSGAFGANAQACTGTGNAGNVGNIIPGDILSFADSAVTYHPTDNTIVNVDLDGISVAATSATSVVLTAKAGVALNSSADPFSRVDFFWVEPISGDLVKIGTASVSLAQTQTTRTYTYKLTWDPAAPVPPGNITVFAIGVDAQGDAVMSSVAGQTVVIVQ
jgi:hypothetical protein